MFDSEFYPTEASLSDRMVGMVNRDCKYFLEPSAGKGDIAEAIKRKFGRWVKPNIDCIESNFDLVGVLQSKELAIIGFDWLEYSGVSYYDAIIMNPPFSNGDDHLLKAWDFLHDGEVVCLLNAETIRNPYSKQRKRLARIIEANGTVEFIQDAFKSAERRTGVEVALVYLKKEGDDDSAELWADITDERQRDKGEEAVTDIALKDTLGNLVEYYEMANLHMINAFKEMRRAMTYMKAGAGAPLCMDEILKLGLKDLNEATAEFVRANKRNSWKSVFNQMEFRRFLDKKQADQFLRDVEKSSDVAFTKENIRGTLQNVFLKREELFKKSIANVFNELIKYDKKNRVHIEGWKTNSNYMVNRKVIFPDGCKFCKIFDKFELSWSSDRIDIYNDLDRLLCVLAGKEFNPKYDYTKEEHTGTVTIQAALRKRFSEIGYIKPGDYFDNTTESEFFHIKFHKKGTLHLQFKDEFLWKQFNITAADGNTALGSMAA